ncbi:MAG TPA: hypothetical protein VMY38_07835 [Gemmatimonadaceae bacterium]|nr:hypothetical protein [Gemmatimonadaceae bacterium]
MKTKSYWLLAIGYWLVGCSPSQPNTDIRQWTDNYAYRISVDPMPPEALKTATYKVVVRDRETNQPVEQGEGRIFATSRDGANTDDGLSKGKEIGTYYGRLFYVISGDWAIAVQFRKDSTARLERADWIQTVVPSTKPGY